jgi:hypothetical protein
MLFLAFLIAFKSFSDRAISSTISASIIFTLTFF